MFAVRFFLRPNIIKDVLVTFEDSKFAWNQVFIKTNSVLSCCSTASMELPVENKLVSSANIIVFNLEETVFKSFMKIRNRIGPRNEP